MVKYSIIIPTYNNEKYLKKCLDSILNNSYKNFIIIVIDDGSTDNTEKIIKNYKEKIEYYKKDNGGVSSARNYGISKVKTPYFMFVDSDDYIDENTLEKVDRNISDADILSFNIRTVDNNKTTDIIKPAFSMTNGENAIVKFINAKTLFDTPVSYVYKTKYFKENNFNYALNKEHEDFGLTPIVIAKASKVVSIENVFYNYVQNNQSITKNSNYDKTIKKAYDFLYHYDKLKEFIEASNLKKETKRIFYSFISNAVIDKVNMLNKIDKKKYIYELRKREVFKQLSSKTLGQRIKKMLININLDLYLKIARK